MLIGLLCNVQRTYKALKRHEKLEGVADLKGTREPLKEETCQIFGRRLNHHFRISVDLPHLNVRDSKKKHNSDIQNF